jgi:hypothetical protein
MTDNTSWRRHLPKAPLLTFEWSWKYFYFARFRLANCRRLQIGWLTVHVRAPYLEHVARVHHPYLFPAEPHHDQ